MNNVEVKRIARLVIQALLDKNLIKMTGSGSDHEVAEEVDNSVQTGSSSVNNTGAVKPNFNQVLTADKVMNCASPGTEKIIVSRSTIITELAQEEAKKMELEIVQE